MHLWMKPALSVLVLVVSASALAQPGYPNHHIHDFAINYGYDGLWNTRAHRHALAMGYYSVTKYKPADPAYADLETTYLHNAFTAGVRVTVSNFNTAGESISVAYLRHWGGDGNTHTLFEVFSEANSLGQSRTINQTYSLGQADLDYIRRYGAAKASGWSSLTNPASVTGQQIIDNFDTSWYSSSATTGSTFSFNITGNHQSVDVVEDMITASTTKFADRGIWGEHQNIFFDSLGGQYNLNSVNGDQGPGGAYDRRTDGVLAFVRAVSDYARDPNQTGAGQPFNCFGNIYDPKSYGQRMTNLRWYADGDLRLDHYYYEAGGVGDQNPNGVVPGTTSPAYVDQYDPNYYIPASRMALDDVYAYNRTPATYDAETHFAQHLDACGSAGLGGAWFGWYGEDYLNREDSSGQYMYTNDMQLARAIPNWDNIAGVPVPDFGDNDPNGPRWFDQTNRVYRSSNSYADEQVLYSRNPFNDELYAVFRDLTGRIELEPGEWIVSAVWTDDLFTATTDSALSALIDQGSGLYALSSGQSDKLGVGIRIVTDRLVGDANGDFQVDDADYTIWADNYGQSGATWATGDFNGDGLVDDADYTLWADHYGATHITPEPATLAMLLLGALRLRHMR